MDEIVQFDFPTDSPKIIKVIGVGGGGGNAVNHMYREGIHDVTFVLCNTDNQALAESPVPVKLQLGEKPFILYPQAVEGRTEGLLLIQFFLIE